MKSSELEEVIANGDKDRIAVAFYEIANKVADYYEKFPNWKYKTDRDDTIQEVVMYCFEKLKKYDPTKGGRVFTYFTTIASSMFTQCRDRGNYEKLKKNYKKHLEGNGNS